MTSPLEKPRNDADETRKRRLRTIRRLRWRQRFFKHLPPVTLILLVIIVIFGTGFVWFSEKINAFTPSEKPQPADAIVVLTGAQSRLGVGLELLENGIGRRLLVSGVNPATNVQTLIRITGADPTLFACCVDLGYEADSTIGNAAEAARWINEHNYHKVYIVTNDYHMLRSMREFKKVMPDVTFLPYAVKAPTKHENGWLSGINELRLLLDEYIKFIGAEIRRFFI